MYNRLCWSQIIINKLYAALRIISYKNHEKINYD